MAKRVRKKLAAKSPARSKKTKRAIAVKSVKPARNPVAKKVAARKPARKVSRRSSAETAKLQKTVLKGLKGGKSVASLAEELGISKPYVYMLKNKR
jgi:hypothetical protein